MAEIPILETERLILRDLRESDLDPFAAMMADEEVARHIGGALTRAEAWRYIATVLGHWILRGYGLWAVERKADRAFLGRVGLINPEGWPGLEVGWALARPYWGQGYATEAGRASLRFAFETQPADALISVIHPDNRASQKVAERLGETRGERITAAFVGKTHEVDIWRIARRDWASSNRAR